MKQPKNHAGTTVTVTQRQIALGQACSIKKRSATCPISRAVRTATRGKEVLVAGCFARVDGVSYQLPAIAERFIRDADIAGGCPVHDAPTPITFRLGKRLKR